MRVRAWQCLTLPSTPFISKLQQEKGEPLDVKLFIWRTMWTLKLPLEASVGKLCEDSCEAMEVYVDKLWVTCG